MNLPLPSRTPDWRRLILAAGAAALLSTAAHAQVIATDNGGNYSTFAVQNGAGSQFSGNGGSGWGPWSGNVTGSGPGSFLGTAPNTGLIGSGNTWGLYSNSGYTANAYRGFNSDIIGETVSIDLENTSSIYGSIGWSLWNSSISQTPLTEFYFSNGNGDWTNTNAASTGNNQNSVGYTTQAIQTDLTITSATTYSLTAYVNGGSSVTTSGVFENSLAATGTSLVFRLFSYNDGSNNNVYFNNERVFVSDYTGGSGNWGTNGNWASNGALSNAPINGADISFGGTVAATATNNLLNTVNGITFLSGAGAYVLTGSAFTLGDAGSDDAAITNNSANLQTVSQNLTLGSAATVATATGSTRLSGNINLNGSQLSLTGTGTATVSGTVSGAAGITTSGAALLTAANTYSGTTTISGGTLQLNNLNAAQNSIVSIGVANGLAFSNSASAGATYILGGLSGSGNEALADTSGSAVTLQLGNNGNTGMSYSGVLSGSGALIINGSGTQALGGANTFGGGVTLNAGTLILNNGASATGTASALGRGTLTIAGGSIDSTVSGITLGTNNPENWNGDFSFVGTNSLNLGAGAITLGGNRVVTVTNNTLTVGGAIGDSGSGYGLTMSGAGTLTLTSVANTYGGITTIQNGGTISSGVFPGTLIIAGDGSLGTAPGSLVANQLTINGATLLVSANTTLAATRGITIGSNGGTIASSSTATLVVDGPIVNNSGGNHLFLESQNAISLAAAITGTGDIVKEHQGSLTLGVANGFVGSNSGANNLYIDNGTVQTGVTGALGTTNGTSTGWIGLGPQFANGTQTGNAILQITSAGAAIANPIDVRYYSATAGDTKTIGSTIASGTATFSGAINLHDTVTLTSASGGTTAFTGVIAVGSSSSGASSGQSNDTTNVLFNAGPGVIVSAPGGTVELDGSNTYSTETYVKSGTLQFGSGGSVNASTIRLGTDGTTSTAAINLLAGGVTVNSIINPQPGASSSSSTLTLEGSNPTGTIATFGGYIPLDANLTVNSANSGATLALTSPYTGSTTSGIDLKAQAITFTGSGNTTVAGTMWNSTGAGGAVVNAPGGTVTLSNSNTYSGSTTVTAGAMIVSGSLNSTASASVSSNGTLEVDGMLNPAATTTVSGMLEGTGNVGAITANGGTIAPGLTAASQTTGGTLTAGGALSLSGSTNFDIRLGVSASGTDSDELVVAGSHSVTLSGTLDLTLGMGVANLPASSAGSLYYVLISAGVAPTGSFTAFDINGSPAMVSGSTISADGYSFDISYKGTSSSLSNGNDVVLEVAAVPEPGTWVGLAMGVAILLTAGKRRRR